MPPVTKSPTATEALREAGVLGRLPELQRIAEELFPGEVKVDLETDPELPSEHYADFRVAASGDLPDIFQRRREWYRRTEAILRDQCDKVRLSVDIRNDR